MSAKQQQLLFDDTARPIYGASQVVLERHIANCSKADPAYGQGVAKTIGISVPYREVEPAK